jgi:hypothetical protein
MDAREINKTRSHQWREDNAEHVKQYRHESYLRHRTNRLLTNYKRKDKKQGLEFNITEEWFDKNIKCKPCTYCGSEKRIGCDRIDNKIGHIASNCIPCCPVCNVIKLTNFTVSEMMKIGQFIAQEIYPYR